MFLDSDDFFESDMLESMLRKILFYNADICLCGADKYDTKAETFLPMPWMLNLKNINEQPFSASQIDGIFQVTSPAPWNKLYSAEFIHRVNLSFQETPRINDMYFTYCALALAEQIVFVDKVFTHYRVNHGVSLQTATHKTPTLCCEVLKAIKIRLEGERCWDHIKDSFINYTIANLDYSIRQVEEFPTEKKKLIDAINLTYSQTLEIENYPVDRITETEAYNRLVLALLEENCNTSNTPDVSLVIPVYNAEKYVAECLNSCITQTHENIEIICVDDASTDVSLQILQSYTKRDSRVHLISKKKNEGCICARRTGILASRGKYIMFVDPDDYLDVTACEIAYKEICTKKVDILQFTIGVEDHDDNKATKTWLENYTKPKDQDLNRYDFQTAMFIDRTIATSLVGKMYYAPKLKLACRQMPAVYGNMGEDIFQQFYYSNYLDTYRGVISLPLYWYRRGLGVTNSQKMDLERFEANCAMATLYEQMACFAQRSKDGGLLSKCAQAVAIRMCEDCVRRWVKQVPEEDKKDAFKILWQYWECLPEREEVFERVTCEAAQTLYERYIGIPIYVRTAPKLKENRDWFPTVSVIIPVYNTENYLRECLNSIIDQTLHSIEIICVNDGSTDGSLSIIKEYQKKDSRLTIISQNNRGLSAARNIGMQYAHGEFMCFIDSDDFLDPLALKKLTDAATTKEADVIYFGVEPVYDSVELHSTYNYDSYYNAPETISDVYTGIEYMAACRDAGKYRPSVCRVLWRHSFLQENQIWFKDGIVHEDNLFTFQALMAASRVIEIPDRLYKRRVRNDSIMTRTKSANNVKGYFICAMGILEYALRQTYDKEKTHEIYRAFQDLIVAAKRDYYSITQEEQNKVSFSTEIVNQLFSRYVLSDYHLDQIQNELIHVKHDLDCVHESVSFRIGRGITWLPRKVRGGVRCYREHGLAYTFDRLLVHARLKEDPENPR